MVLEKGTGIQLYTPPLVEAISSMLASVRLGAPFESVFTGFSYWELARRIVNRNPKIIVTADGFYIGGKVIDTLSMLRRALEVTKCGCKVIVIERIGSRKLLDREMSFDDLYNYSNSRVEEATVESNHPLFGLHSGYEDSFKPITHSTGGFLTQVYVTTRWIGLRPHDTYYCTVWPGWITGVSLRSFRDLL